MVKNSKLWLSTVSALALALSPAASPLVQPAFSEEDPSDQMPEDVDDMDIDQTEDVDVEDDEQIEIPNIDFETLTEVQITDESGSISVFTGDVLADLISGFEEMPEWEIDFGESFGSYSVHTSRSSHGPHRRPLL